MARIRIREQLKQANGFQAMVIFEDEKEFDVTIRNPFSDAQERLLEWYFEEHLRFPFLDQTKATTAAQSIKEYGENLFQQIFATPAIYALYQHALQAGMQTSSIEIVGSPDFHRLHWEAMKDPQLDYPLAPHTSILRRNVRPSPFSIVPRDSTTINVLLVTARPFGKNDVGYRTISRPLVQELRQSKLPINIDVLRPGTYQAFIKHLRDATTQHGAGYYHIIHFDLHGAILTYEQLEQGFHTNSYQYAPYGHPPPQKYQGTTAFLFFEGEGEAKADPVQADTLATLLQEHQTPIAILNACQSGKEIGKQIDQRESSLGSILVQKGVQCVVAMGYSVTVTAAQVMMQTLYSQLFSTQDVSTAIRYAREELYNRKERRAYYNQQIDLEDWMLPIVYQNHVPRLTVKPFTTPEEATAFFQREANRYPAPATTYQFVGRDLDILRLEKLLLTHRNIALIRGMGGSGKTTLLHHLAYWWQTTGLVNQVFFFSYEQQAWTRQQLLVTLAQRLLDPVQYALQFQPLTSLDAQQALVTRLLRSSRHLLILDNLESITGTSLAI